MNRTKSVTTPAALKADGSEGSISAVFSTFGVVDGDGDVLVREAFTDGQAVPMVWAHDWQRPVGKGTIRTDPKRAIFDGRFFLDTTAGRDAYLTVKAMGSLQEFSWGFSILDATDEVRDGAPVRIITKAEVFEVSPVLVGSNRETYTLAIKAKRRLSRHQIEAVITTLQALIGDDEAAELLEDAAAADEGASKSAAPLAGSLAEIGPTLTAELAGLRQRLLVADVAERAELRGWGQQLADQLRGARLGLEAQLRTAEAEAELETQTLFQIADLLDVRYGAIAKG